MNTKSSKEKTLALQSKSNLILPEYDKVIIYKDSSHFNQHLQTKFAITCNDNQPNLHTKAIWNSKYLAGSFQA